MKTILLAAAAGLLANSAYAANLIRNGSFETPVAVVGSYLVFTTGESFTGWKVVGASGSIGIVNTTFQQNGFTFPALSGNQWVDLTGLSQTATGIQQTVPTTAGAAYTLTFYIGNANNPGGIFGITSTVNVLVNGRQVFTATNSRGAGQTKQVWQKFTTTITAASAHTAIAFINGDPSNDTNNGLDLVSLVAQADDEPVPDSPPADQE